MTKCKHEWRQYFERIPPFFHLSTGTTNATGELQERGFYCIHCKKRSD